MESTIQIILIICILSLTAIFVTAGIWVILILREIRKATQKVSKIGDDVEETSHFVKQKIKDGFSMMALLATLSTIWSKKDRLVDILPEIKNKMAEGLKPKAESEEPKDFDGERSRTAESKEKENAENDKKENKKKKKRRFFFRKEK